MQKITEIKEYYTIKRKQMVNGEQVFVENKVSRFRDVKYVDGLPRFGHFLLDRVFFYIFAAVIFIPIGIVLVLMGISIDEDTIAFKVLDIIISWFILQPAYYFIFEAFAQGSPAKLILGRIVVDEYGNKPTASQILTRSFVRCIPFEYFSCLSSTGWHDDWSKTFVIRKKDLKELKLLQKINNIENETPLPNEPLV